MTTLTEHPYARTAHFLSADSYPWVDELDARDRELIAEHTVPYWFDPAPLPQVGDWVVEAGCYSGAKRRIAFLLPDGRFQPGPSIASYYLGRASASFSGAPDRSMPLSALRPTVEAWNATFWIFHHDHPQASNSVNVHVPRRVWSYPPPATHLFQARALKVL